MPYPRLFSLAIGLYCLFFTSLAYAQSGKNTVSGSQEPLQPAVLGHISIQTSNIDSLASFYKDCLQMEVQEKAVTEDETRYLLSNTDSHHQFVLLDKEEAGGGAKPVLVQIAFQAPNHASLVQHYRHIKSKVPVELKDNQISWSVYFKGPDGNQIEIYWDIRDEPFGSPLWNNNSEPLPEAASLKGEPER